VTAPDRLLTASFEHTVGVNFGGAIELAGFDLTGAEPVAAGPNGAVARLPAGRTLGVRLVWLGRAPLSRAHAVFVQLLDPDGRLVAQHDAPPAAGTRPVTGIIPGEYVPDDHPLPGSAHLAPGAYTLIAGLYDPITGERLPTPSGQTFVELGRIEIR
ncbi:MAG TPA: hypothetical protein VHL09_09955, partial [Dehalococcoidia bacterium]|nr:hypothetical protein [Dehalococcoidia bacterium]